MIVVLYTNHCVRCGMLRSRLREKKVEFTEIDDMDIMRDMGFDSMPVLQIDDEFYNFADAMKWANERVL